MTNTNSRSEDSTDPIGVQLAQRLVVGIEKLEHRLEQNQKLFVELRDLLKEFVEVQGELSDDIGLWTRAMEILTENKRNGKVSFTDLAKSFELASDEQDDEDEDDGEGAEEPEEDPVLPGGGRR